MREKLGSATVSTVTRSKATPPASASYEAFRLLTFSRGSGQIVVHCAQHSHPPNPERAETRSCPWRAHSYRARSASKKDIWPLPLFLLSATSRSSPHLRPLTDLPHGTPSHEESLSNSLATTP